MGLQCAFKYQHVQADSASVQQLTWNHPSSQYKLFHHMGHSRFCPEQMH